MARKTKQPALMVQIGSDAELEAMLAQIGQAEARVARLTAANDESKARLDEVLAEECAEPNAFAAEARKAVQAYIEANRARLTPKGKKTITLKSGSIEYRAGVLSIGVRGADAVIFGLKQLGLAHFVTIKESVNKQALLDYVRAHGNDALPDVAGLALKQSGETIDIKPNQTQEDVGV